MEKVESALGPLRPFLGAAVQFLKDRNITIEGREIDHVCYRCGSVSEYKRVLITLVDGGIGYILEESMIGGRPITVVMLDEPIIFESWTIKCIEVPCPKPGRSHGLGWEHMEVVIGEDGDHCAESHHRLHEFVAKHPDLQFDMKAANKEINADVCLDIGNNMSIKFHVWPLYKVCQYEKSNGCRVPVPENYFDSVPKQP